MYVYKVMRISELYVSSCSRPSPASETLDLLGLNILILMTVTWEFRGIAAPVPFRFDRFVDEDDLCVIDSV